jgi:hypothetical protein
MYDLTVVPFRIALEDQFQGKLGDSWIVGDVGVLWSGAGYLAEGRVVG